MRNEVSAVPRILAFIGLEHESALIIARGFFSSSWGEKRIDAFIVHNAFQRTPIASSTLMKVIEMNCVGVNTYLVSVRCGIVVEKECFY
jgi:hypothetical protein